MLKIVLFLSIIVHLNAAWGQFTFNPTQVCGELEREMKNDTPENDVCAKMAGIYSPFFQVSPELNLSSKFDVLCRDMRNLKDNSSISAAKALCNIRAGEIDPGKQQTFGAFWENMVDNLVPTVHEPSAATAVTTCSANLFDDGEKCLAPKSPALTPGIVDLKDIFTFQASSITSKPYSSEHCECLEKNYNDVHFMDNKFMTDELETERKNINQLIFQAAGQKLLNNFAGTLEDIKFYLHNKGDIFGLDAQSTLGLQCNKAEDFQREIDRSCAANNVSKSVSDARMGWIMNSLGDNYNSPTLQGKFDQLEYDILNIPIDGSKLETGAKHRSVYTREEFDKSRYSIYRTMPAVKFLDTITYQILLDQDLRSSLRDGLNEGKNPGHVIMTLLSKNDDSKMRNLLKRVLNENRGNAFYDELALGLKTGSAPEFSEKLLKAYQSSINAHPGIKAVFSNTNLFKRLMENGAHERAHTGNFSIIGEMDQHPEFMRDYFTSKCNELKTFFAQTACNKGDNYIENTEPNDLNALLAKVPSKYNKSLKDLLLCRQNKNQTSGKEVTVWTQLNFSRGDMLRQSDFLDRKLSGEKVPARNAFSAMARQKAHGDSAISRDIERQNQIFANERVSVMESDQGSRFYKGDSPEVVQSEMAANAPVKPDATLEGLKRELPARETPVTEVAQVPALLNPVTSQAAISTPGVEASPKTNNETKWREQIRDYLSEGRDSKEIERHLSNTGPGDLQELVRLREEVSRDREKMLELVRESERQKIATLESTYKDLETKYNNAVKAKTESDLTQNTATISNEPGLDNIPTPRYIDSGAQDGSGRGYTSTTQAASAGRASAGISGGGSNAISSGRSPASSSLKPDSSQGSAGDIIVVSSNAKSSSPQDLNQELISFVNKNDDVQTLLKLKENGLVYKYKVVENGVEIEKEVKVDYSSLSPEAKQILDRKIATNEQFQRLENDYLTARRSYSFSTLKMILGIQAQRNLDSNIAGK